MEKLAINKGQLKAQAKKTVGGASDKSEQVVSDLNTRTIFVGDDTGLLKRLNMTMTMEDDIISMPAVRKVRRDNRRNRPEFNTEDLEEELL